MRTSHRSQRGSAGLDRQRGQSLVEFAIIVPIILALVVSVAELGFIFGKLSSLGYASREGARTGAALARGEGVDYLECSKVLVPPVDATIVAAAQRILTSPDSGIDLSRDLEIRIFKATAAGAEDGVHVNRWRWRGTDTGPDIDPDPLVTEELEFRELSEYWPACTRVNQDAIGGVPGGAIPDSIGVTVLYTYDFVTPLPALINAIAGGALSLRLSETTVMALNPKVFD